MDIKRASKPDEYLIFMAHWDHLGVNDELVGDQIFNGAADNAAGVAAVIELQGSLIKYKQKDQSYLLH